MSLIEQLSKGISLLNNDDPVVNAHTNTNANANAIAASAPVVPKKSTNDEIKTNPLDRIIQSLQIFEKLQNEIQSAAIFSTNECLNDVSTSSLSLLAVEYHMAKAYLQLQYRGSKERWMNVTKAMELIHLYLSRCYEYASLFDDTLKSQYEHLLSIHDSHHRATEEEGENLIASSSTDHLFNNYTYKIPPQSRDEKIQNYKLSKSISSQIANYRSKLDQRSRLSL